MNFVFIYAKFSEKYWNFCRGLKNNGVNTLAIGDEEYDNLSTELKNVLNEYYKVSSLENYDEVYQVLVHTLLLNMVVLIGWNQIMNTGF